MEKIRPDQRKLILQQPLHQQFVLHYSHLNGGVVLVHKLVDSCESDFKLLIDIGTALANEGKKNTSIFKTSKKYSNFL